MLELLATAPTCFDSTDTPKMCRVSPRRRCLTAFTGETMSSRSPDESRCMSEQLRVRCKTRRQSLDIVRCRVPRLLRYVLSLTGLKSAPKSDTFMSVAEFPNCQGPGGTRCGARDAPLMPVDAAKSRLRSPCVQIQVHIRGKATLLECQWLRQRVLDLQTHRRCGRVSPR